MCCVNFRERRHYEVRRIYLPRTLLNRPHLINVDQHNARYVSWQIVLLVAHWILKETLATERSRDLMTAIKAFIKSHPLLSYFALAFAISWGGVLLVIGGPGAMPGTGRRYETLLPIVGPAMLAGSAVAGILLTGLVDGRAGLRKLLSRLLRWRVGARWWAVALLTGPLFMTAVLLVLSLTSPEFLSGIFASD